MNDVPKDYWLLDCQLAAALGTSHEVYIWAPAEGKDLRVSFYETARGLDLRYMKDHHGGQKTFKILNPCQLSREPMSTTLRGGGTANGLYLICMGEHTGKLMHRVQYISAHPPDQGNDI